MDQSKRADAAQMLLDMLAGWHEFVADRVDEPEPSPDDENPSEVSYASYTEEYSDATFDLYQKAGELVADEHPDMTPREFITRFVIPFIESWEQG